MDAPTGFMYHFSPSENRESIQRDGLQTGVDGFIWYTNVDEGEPGEDRWLVDVRGLELHNEEIAPGMWFYTRYEEIPPWRLTLDQEDNSKLSKKGWHSTYHYREAGEGESPCATCDAFVRGKCLMFNDPVKEDYTCDEWTDKPTWRLGNYHWSDAQEFDEEGNPIYNITNGDEVIRGIPLDQDNPNPNIFQYVPEPQSYSLDEALENLRSWGDRWEIRRGDEPQMWRLHHRYREEAPTHDISSRDLQLKGYHVYYNDPYLPRAPANATGPKDGHYHLYDSNDPTATAGRIWATQRVDDIPDWEEPPPGTLNEPWTRERMPDLWKRHWGKVIPPAGVPFETYAKFVMKSQWADIQAKAKRLIMENKVTLLVNTPTSIVAHVIGDGSDNGGEPDEHEVEISRDDPDSNVITQSICDCKWNQYRWDRTRKWKKWEGRVCSHILAAYWKSKSTPIDITDLEPGTEYQTPVGQKGPTAQPGQMQIPIPKPTPMTQEPIVEEQATPAPTAPPLNTAPPANQFAPGKQVQRTPKVPQREQLQLFNINPDPQVQTAPPAGGFSQPGQAPPDAENVQLPGTFSSWHTAIVDIGACARCGQPIGADGYCMVCGQYNDEFERPQRVPRFQQGMPEQSEWQPAQVEWGGQQVTAMAERSGDPELDSLVEAFVAQNQTSAERELTDEEWEDDWTHGDPPTHSLEDMRNPEYARGACSIIAEDWDWFARAHGLESKTVDVVSVPDHPYDVDLSSIGLADAQNFDPRGMHCLSEVTTSTGTYLIDWTASQYGYTEFPMIQRKAEGGWQRKW